MKTNSFIYPAMVTLAILIISGCCNRNAKSSANADEPETESYLTAVDNYLTKEIGANYLQGDVCIPFCPYTSVDESSSEDILVWGDFWVLNYTVSGDTLNTVSGGSHPGKMHVRKYPDGHFEVTSFEAVEDGSGWEPSARRIFGERFDDFQKSNSDEKRREGIRMEAVAEYVRGHQLPVSIVKDYGWPAIPIPKSE